MFPRRPARFRFRDCHRTLCASRNVVILIVLFAQHEVRKITVIGLDLAENDLSQLDVLLDCCSLRDWLELAQVIGFHPRLTTRLTSTGVLVRATRLPQPGVLVRATRLTQPWPMVCATRLPQPWPLCRATRRMVRGNRRNALPNRLSRKPLMRECADFQPHRMNLKAHSCWTTSQIPSTVSRIASLGVLEMATSWKC